MRWQFLGVVAIAAAVVVPAHADVVTYDFVGVVTKDSGFSGVADGATVTGTYIINFANADPAQSSGLVGSQTANWVAENYGGSAYGTTPPGLAEYVMSSTVHIGSFSYVTTPSTYENLSVVEGGVVSPPTSDYIQGEELSYSSANTFTGSSFYFQATGTAGLVWTSSGQPIPSSSNFDSGEIYNFNNGTGQSISYNITSFVPAPVPLPAAAWLMLSGLAGLGAAGRRRQAAINGSSCLSQSP